jgi:hypothetical protein
MMRAISGIISAVATLGGSHARPSARSAARNDELLRDRLDMKATIVTLATEAERGSFEATPSGRGFARQIHGLVGHTWARPGRMTLSLRLNGGTPPAVSGTRPA